LRARRPFGHPAIVQLALESMPSSRQTRPASGRAARSAPSAPPARSVLFIGSEALPFSKTGGLADVLGALPLALGRIGWDVTLVIPRYRGNAAGEIVGERRIAVGGFLSPVRYHQVPLAENVRAILV